VPTPRAFSRVPVATCLAGLCSDCGSFTPLRCVRRLWVTQRSHADRSSSTLSHHEGRVSPSCDLGTWERSLKTQDTRTRLQRQLPREAEIGLSTELICIDAACACCDSAVGRRLDSIFVTCKPRTQWARPRASPTCRESPSVL
jgi:hypothetical protein